MNDKFELAHQAACSRIVNLRTFCYGVIVGTVCFGIAIGHF